MKKIGSIVYWLVLAVLITVAGLTAVSTLEIPGNYKLLVVLSGSMEPAIKTGSVVVVRPAKQYFKGDVITFRDPVKPKVTIIHRIAQVRDKDSLPGYVVKGDANSAPDIGVVSGGQIIGGVIAAIPFLGYPASFAKTQTGLLIFIIIPAVIIIYSQLLNIKNEIIHLLNRKKNEENPT